MSLHSQRLTQIAMGSSSDLCFGDSTLSILDLSHSTAVGQHFHDAILRGVEESPRLQERHSSEIVLQLHSFNLCLALQCSRRHENGLLIFTLKRHGTVSTQNQGVDSLNSSRLEFELSTAKAANPLHSRASYIQSVGLAFAVSTHNRLLARTTVQEQEERGKARRAAALAGHSKISLK